MQPQPFPKYSDGAQALTLSEKVIEKAAKIKLVVTDVDGVWTDGGMYYSEHGDELKKFNTRDGKGVELLRQNGIEVAIVTGERTVIVSRRAKKLGLELEYQGVSDKRQKLEEIMRQFNLAADEVAFIGDDLNDLSALNVCGLSATVADGMPSVQAVVDYVCHKAGGEGAFREFAELILRAKKSPRRTYESNSNS